VPPRLTERLRWRRRADRGLAERARAAAPRPPLVIVPSCFGVAMADQDGRPIWGNASQFWVGPQFPLGGAATQRELLREFTIVPGLPGVDVFGGLVRYLEHVGGYTYGEDLFAVSYDWRAGHLSWGRELAEGLRALRGAGELEVDLLALSSGGTAVRNFLAWGDGTPEAPGALPVPVRRVVYVCSPQRGSLSSLEYILDGIEFVPWSRRFRDIERVPGIWDMLPHPDEPIFMDRAGNRVDASVYDPAVWRRFKMRGHDTPELDDRLARALALHRALDGAAARPHPPSWIIGSNHEATAARAVIEDDRVVIPHCMCDVDGKTYPRAYEPGDGTVPAATVAAAPGPLHGPWWTPIEAHQYMGRDPGVRRLIVEALIAPSKVDARGLYQLRKPESRAEARELGRASRASTPPSPK
jgi:hypothetical protein